jgi:hypothetical protein
VNIEDIEVPEGMLEAVMNLPPKFSDGYWRDYNRKQLAVALFWLGENPILPSDEECSDMASLYKTSEARYINRRELFGEWQRRMFLKRAPALPEVVKAMMLPEADGYSQSYKTTREQVNKAIVAAYEMGLAKATEGSK